MDRHSSNGSRHLDSYIRRTKKALPIKTTFVQTPLRSRAFARCRKLTAEPWPVLRPRDWASVAFDDPWRGFFLLGGHQLEHLDLAEDMLERFWSRYCTTNATSEPPCRRRTIPVYVHGDEGRGLAKRPIMIVSVQPVIGWSGEHTVNLKKKLGHQSFVSSLLVT